MFKQGKIDPDTLINLSPYSFDAEADSMYFKPAEYRQSIDLPGGYSTSIEDEYQVMEELHGIAGGLVVEPFALTREPEGYVMEYVDGEGLNEVLRRDLSDYDIEAMLEDVRSFGEIIKDEGVPHGDIRRGNFIVDDSDSLKIIDAAGIPEGIEGPGFGTLRDQAVIWDITDLNERIIDQLVEESDLEVDSSRYYIEHPKQNIMQ